MENGKRNAEIAEAAEFAGGIPDYKEELELDDGLIDKDKIPCSVDEMYEEARLGHPHAIAWVLRHTLHRERRKRYELRKGIPTEMTIPRRLRFVALNCDKAKLKLKGFLSVAPDVENCFGGGDTEDDWRDTPIEFYLTINLLTLVQGGESGIIVSAKY